MSGYLSALGEMSRFTGQQRGRNGLFATAWRELPGRAYIHTHFGFGYRFSPLP